MDTEQLHEPVICPHCGAANSPDSLLRGCWLCYQGLIEQPNAFEAADTKDGSTRERAAAATTFHLSSLMLLIALVAVCLGVIHEAPGLGIMLAIVSTPALIRTFIVSQRRRAVGQSITVGNKVGTFLGTLGLGLCIFVATGAAFFFTCFGVAVLWSNPNNKRGAAIELGIEAGIFAALLVASLLIWWLFWLRSRKTQP